MSEIMVPSPNNGYAMPFFYGAIRSCWAFFAVDKEVADDMLVNGRWGDTTLESTLFTHDSGTTALACLNFMHYPAYGPNFGSFTTELEMNIVAHPKSKTASIPSLSVREFLYGAEQTKLVGYFRLHVIADGTVAIAAGRSVFGEYKYFGQFSYNIPAYSLQLNQSDPKAMLDWTFASHVQGGVPYPVATNPDELPGKNFEMTLHMSQAQPEVASSQNCITDYSMWSAFDADQVNAEKTPVPPLGAQLNGSRRNYLLPFTTYFVGPDQQDLVELTYGDNDNDLGLTSDMKQLFGDTPNAVGMASVRSEPAVIESPAYFANEI